MLRQLLSSVEGVHWPAIPDNAASAMLALLFQLEKSQWLAAEETWELQQRQLRALLEHARAHVPFYRHAARRDAFRLPDNFSPTDFARLPILTRSDLQQSFADLCADKLPARHGELAHASTSGSTGEPVRFATTALTNFLWQSFVFRDHLWHGRDFSAKTLAIRSGAERATLGNWFGDAGTSMLKTGPCVILPAGWSLARQLDAVMEEKPAYVLSYANNLVGLFREAERRGVQMPWLREARSYGERVTPEIREYFQARWRLPFSDAYSTREVGYIALQCPLHPIYHVQAENAYVEVLDDDGNPCGEGETGRVVVTPLQNFGMPLVRYEFGDYATVGRPCPCGRGLPVLERVDGRHRNLLHLPDGSKRWATLGTGKLLDLAPIRRFKVVQKTLRDIEVRLIVERPVTDGEMQALHRHFSSCLGEEFRLEFRFLDEFPPQPGDKFEDFVSEVGQGPRP